MNAIYYIGLDIHKKVIAYCIKRIDGELVTGILSLFTSDKESVLNIDAYVTTIRQFYIQRQFAAKRLNVPFERRNFNFVATFFKIGDGG